MVERCFAFATTPPRHGKTELIKHGIVHRLLADPRCRIGYGSYSDRFAQKRSREIRKLYIRAGGQCERGASSVADWRTGVGDGGLWAAGVGGSWTGEGFNLIVVDDPIKGRAIAESAVEREKLWDFHLDDLETRLEPGGSFLAVHTRWHVDDYGGRLLAKGCIGNKVEHIHLPAIDAKGAPLWPERFTLEELERIRASKGPYGWASLYMGAPFPKGGRVFNDVQFYDAADLPETLRVAIGIDLAYSSKTRADWSCIVLLGIDDITGNVFVLEVIRKQEKAPVFANRIRAVQERFPGVDARWYYAGPEKGIVDFEASLGVEIDAQAAAADKFIRAQPVAAAWNGTEGDAGELVTRPRVFVPREAEWLDDFVAELVAFTGSGDLNDDQVDALAAAFDSASQPGWVSAFTKWRRDGAKPLLGQTGHVPTARPAAKWRPI